MPPTLPTHVPTGSISGTKKAVLERAGGSGTWLTVTVVLQTELELPMPRAAPLFWTVTSTFTDLTLAHVTGEGGQQLGAR